MPLNRYLFIMMLNKSFILAIVVDNVMYLTRLCLDQAFV